MATMDEAISVHSSSRAGTPALDRRAILTPAIHNVVSALGGHEQISPTETVYVLGDSCLGCLKDLKRLWRKDDTDDERTVARIFYESRVLQNDLIPILLETAGKGKVEDRCALACADLITAMTWPIDIAEELKELDDDDDAPTDYTTLLEAHRSYKAAILRSGVIAAIFSIMLPPLAKGKQDRTERDGQIINLILHCFRNLAFIKDPPPRPHASGEQAEYATLQSKLIITLQQTHVLDAILTFASNADDPMFNPWNNLLLEIFYLLFRGVQPSALSMDQREKTKEDLRNLLEGESKSKREERKHSSSRHSRFGTTISVKSGKETFIMHRQQGIKGDTSSVMDMTKKKVTKRVKKQDELGGTSFLTIDALTNLQSFAKGFITNCFNRFLSSLLKDIRAERAKITEKDNLRLLYVAKWFLEFFLHVREREGETIWRFTLVSEVVDETWVPWVLRRMREAQDDKPKQWTELRAGVDCLTQLLLLIECMSLSNDDIFAEVSQALQHKLYYNGEILDLAFDTLKSYKEGNQSIAYLDSTIHLGYVLLRVLEKWAKTKGDMVVRRKKKAKKSKKKAKGVTEEEGIVDVASEEEMEEQLNEDDEYRESMTTFEAYETRFANPDITNTCLFYLSRYKEFDSSEQMKRIVGLLHRQAVRVKAEGLFFQVTTLELFYRLLKEEKMLPRDQPHIDLIQLVKFILRKFFKAVAEDSFTLVEAFFPTGRGRWKQKSSFVPPKNSSKRGLSDSEDEVSYDDEGNPRRRGKAKESKHGPDVYVKKGHSWSEQVGIAIACLIEDDKMALVDWVKEILIFVIGSRQRIVDETDNFWGDNDKDDDPDADPDEVLRRRAERMKMPSADAARKFEDYIIPYETQAKADAATKNPHLKLVFRLVKFFVTEEDAEELEWYVPAAVIPDELQRSLNVVDQFVREPLDLKGKKAAEMLAKKRAAGGGRTGGRRRRRKRGGSGSGNEGLSGIDLDDLDDEPRQKRKKKEKEQYKSAQFINDSDAELGDDDEFFARERALREKTAMTAVEGGDGIAVGGSNMASAGTKKRKKKTKDVVAKKFKTWKAGDNDGGFAAGGADRAGEIDVESDADDDEPPAVPKPRPKPRRKRATPPVTESNPTSAAEDAEQGITDDGNSSPSGLSPQPTPPRPRPKPRRRFGGGSTAADADPVTSSPSMAPSVADDDDDDDIARDQPTTEATQDSSREVSFGVQDDEDDVEPIVGVKSRRRKPIVIASDDDE